MTLGAGVVWGLPEQRLGGLKIWNNLQWWGGSLVTNSLVPDTANISSLPSLSSMFLSSLSQCTS